MVAGGTRKTEREEGAEGSVVNGRREDKKTVKEEQKEYTKKRRREISRPDETYGRD